MKIIHHLTLNATSPAKQPNEIVGYLPTPFIEKRFHFLFDYNNDEIIVENQEGRICARYYIPSLKRYRNTVDYFNQSLISPMVLIEDKEVSFHLFDDRFNLIYAPITSDGLQFNFGNCTITNKDLILEQLINDRYEFHYHGDFIRIHYLGDGLIRVWHANVESIQVSPTHNNWLRCLKLIKNDQYQAAVDGVHYMDNAEQWLKNGTPFEKWSLDERRDMEGCYNTRFVLDDKIVNHPDTKKADVRIITDWKPTEYRDEYDPVFDVVIGREYAGHVFLPVKINGEIKYCFDTINESKHEELKKQAVIKYYYPGYVEQQPSYPEPDSGVSEEEE